MHHSTILIPCNGLHQYGESSAGYVAKAQETDNIDGDSTSTASDIASYNHCCLFNELHLEKLTCFSCRNSSGICLADILIMQVLLQMAIEELNDCL